MHGNGSELSNSPRTFNCAYIGYFDGANPSTLAGWAWKAGVDTPTVSIDIFDSSTLILTGVPANRFRSDLPGAGIGDGYHAFMASMPASVNDGQDHFLYTRISGLGIDLDNSPRLVTPNPGPVYQGYESGERDHVLYL